MKRKYIIKWINRWSGESGYVSRVLISKKHFVNTFDVSKARRYNGEDEAKQGVSLLNTIGEGTNNEFVIVPA